MQVDTKMKWEKGMKEEMDSLVNNHTWDLVQLPARKRALQNKWVYKLKEEDGGVVGSGGAGMYLVGDAGILHREGRHVPTVVP